MPPRTYTGEPVDPLDVSNIRLIETSIRSVERMLQAQTPGTDQFFAIRDRLDHLRDMLWVAEKNYLKAMRRLNRSRR